MSGIKRYEMDVDVHNTKAYAFEKVDGEWVKFADLTPIVQEAFRNGKRAKEFEMSQMKEVSIEATSS